MNSQRQLFLIGDRCNLVDRLGEMLTANNQPVTRFRSTEEFLENRTVDSSGCLLFVACRRQSPLELIKEMARRGFRIPLILITGRDGKPATAPLSRQGCPVHHLVQPVTRQDVLQAIERIFHIDLQREMRDRQRDAIHARLCRLSGRQRSRSRLRIIGRLAREIADQLSGDPANLEPRRLSTAQIDGMHPSAHRRQLSCPADCLTARPQLMVEPDPVD